MKKTVVAVIAFVCKLSVVAQIGTPSNPQAEWLLANPSFAGINGGTRLQQTTSQTGGFSFPFVSFYFGADQYIKKAKAGIGLYNKSTGNGNFNSISTACTWAQHFSFDGGSVKLIPAIKIGHTRTMFNSAFISSSFLAPVSTKHIENSVSLGLSALCAVKQRFYFGFLLENSQVITDKGFAHNSFFVIPALYLSYELIKKTDLNLNIHYYRQGPNFFSTNMVGAKLCWHNLLLGTGYGYRSNQYVSVGYRNSFISAELMASRALNRFIFGNRANLQLNLAARIGNFRPTQVHTTPETW